jgi:hypothetical protein
MGDGRQNAKDNRKSEPSHGPLLYEAPSLAAAGVNREAIPVVPADFVHCGADLQELA